VEFTDSSVLISFFEEPTKYVIAHDTIIAIYSDREVAMKLRGDDLYIIGTNERYQHVR